MQHYGKLSIEGELTPGERLIAAETIAMVQRLLGEGCSHAEASHDSLLSVVLSGSISPNDLEAVKSPLERLHNLGCAISVFDARNNMTRIDFVSNSLVYRSPGSGPGSNRENAADGQRHEERLDGPLSEPPPKRANSARQALVLCLVVVVLVLLYFKLGNRGFWNSGPDGGGRGDAASAGASGREDPPSSGLESSVNSTPRPEDSEFEADVTRPAPSHSIEFDEATRVFVRDIDSSTMSGTFKSNYTRLAKMLRDYRDSHTYSMDDFFVCVDMVNDVCNMIKTQGMDAAMVVGRVDMDMDDLSDQEYLSSMNHAWVVAEIEPGAWMPVEATGGGIIPPGIPNYERYTRGVHFGRAGDFKAFVELRQRTGEVCRDANDMAARFNEQFAGRPENRESIARKGAVEQRRAECESLAESVLTPVREGRR